jgi:surface antigen
LECQKKRGEEEDGNHNSPSHQKITETKTKQNPKTQKKRKRKKRALKDCNNNKKGKKKKTSRKNRPGGCGSWVSSRRAQAQRQAIHG